MGMCVCVFVIWEYMFELYLLPFRAAYWDRLGKGEGYDRVSRNALINTQSLRMEGDTVLLECFFFLLWLFYSCCFLFLGALLITTSTERPFSDILINLFSSQFSPSTFSHSHFAVSFLWHVRELVKIFQTARTK